MEKFVIQRLRMAINSYSMTFTFLAERLKIKPATLTSKLNGTRSLDINTLCMILNALPFLSPEWVLTGRGDMEKKATTSDPDDSLKCSDIELKEMYIEQSKEIYRLKKRIAQLEQEKIQK